ncbi:MAG TPA: thiamine phosphate synthase [Solirubrobacteraceae bacterium]|nr:thiamine phosphate synthase [Solirubrobacteraceae bacterium]
MVDRRERLSSASLYLVCDAQPDEFLRAALRGGVEIVQLRVKHGADAEVLRAAERYREITAAHDALLIVNDDPELALAADADGVHVGQDDMPVADAREIVGPDRLIGLSTHTPAQIDAARGVDYIGVGPVHATPTKPGRPAVGLELVRYAASHARVPFFAIGGIDPGNVDAVRAAGASRIAVVRALTLAGDPEAAARALQGVSVGAA